MRDDLNFRMFLFHHFNPPYRIENEFMVPVQLADIDSDFPVRDDGRSGSIRGQNKCMAEYTGMYYLWQHLAGTCDWIGLGHYSKVLLPGKGDGLPMMSVPEFSSRYREFGFSEAELAGLFAHHDAILPEPHRATLDGLLAYASGYIRPRFGFRSDAEVMRPVAHLDRHQHMTLRQHYAAMHFQDDFDKLLEAIGETHGAHERAACEQVADAVGEYYGNLVLMRWSVFDQYMAWSWPLMQYLAARIDAAAPRYAAESYQGRVFGFLSERMLTLFLRTRDLRLSDGHRVANISYPKFEVTNRDRISVSLDYLKSLEKFDPYPVSPARRFLADRLPGLVPVLRFIYRRLLPGRLVRSLGGR